MNGALAYILLLMAIGPGTRWAFSSPPDPHPLPRPPPYTRLRASRIWRTFDLLVNWRLINLPPSPPLPRSSRIYLSFLHYHFFYLLYHVIASDILTYPSLRLMVDYPSASYTAFRLAVAHQYDVPKIGVDALIAISQGVATYHGLCLAWHLFALLGIGSGLWIGEEWPKISNKPHLATSLNEFWGRRWHQLLREPIAFVLSFLPFTLPRSLYILTFFLISGLIHSPLFYAVTGSFNFPAFISSFFIYGLGCVLEREFWLCTGKRKRVGGPLGVVWMWIWLIGGTIMMVSSFWKPESEFLMGQIKESINSSFTHIIWQWYGKRY
nr:uncharacterized protein CI109_006585 [Kwoniella shandongensis]KAA5525123.1 hypothetical protein CI109_006585 [Kwoniella shandongensis]